MQAHYFHLKEDTRSRENIGQVGGNPVEKHYDKFCKLHNGKKHILKDSIRDKSGNYHDDIIYEIVKGGGVE